MKHEYNTSFITFGGRNGRCRHAARRLCREAKALDLFDLITGYTDKDLKRDFPDFWEKHGNWIQTHPRGCGYWLWKPFLILHHLNAMRDGDLLLYADAGCEMNPWGKQRLQEYFALCMEHSVLTFRLASLTRDWTKMDTLLRLDPELQMTERTLHEASDIMLKKTRDTINMVQEWFAVCTENHYHYLDDSESVAPNTANFQEHRHDQSMFTLLLIKHGLDFSLPNATETWFPPKRRHIAGAHHPIWVSRNKSGVTSNAMMRLRIDKAENHLSKVWLYCRYALLNTTYWAIRWMAESLLRRLGLLPTNIGATVKHK